MLEVGIGVHPERARLGRRAPELERLVVSAQLRHALRDLRLERALAFARLAAPRYARTEGLRGEAERCG